MTIFHLQHMHIERMTYSVAIVSIRVVGVADALLLRELRVTGGPTNLHDALAVQHHLVLPFALQMQQS